MNSVIRAVRFCSCGLIMRSIGYVECTQCAKLATASPVPNFDSLLGGARLRGLGGPVRKSPLFGIRRRLEFFGAEHAQRLVHARHLEPQRDVVPRTLEVRHANIMDASQQV